MHVASLSKIVTAIAMTRLLGGAGISPSTPIIDYLPGYWAKGPHVGKITFAELMTHTSGLAFGATNSRSDFKWMKSQIAAGTTHRGQFYYQNMNFGLCRILLATINGNIPVDWTLPGWLDWLFRVQRHLLGPHHDQGLRVIRGERGLRARGRDRAGLQP